MWSYAFANKRVNRGDTDKLEVLTKTIKNEIIDQDRGADALRMDLCRMMLMFESLKRVLIDRGVISEEEFEQAVLDADLADGVRDGVYTQKKVPRITCSQCKRLNRKRAYCYFCGQPLHVKERVNMSKRRCPKCEQINPTRLQRCQYCGAGLGPARGSRQGRRGN